MSLCKGLLVAAGVLASGVWQGQALALPSPGPLLIDFRDAAWASAAGLGSFGAGALTATAEDAVTGAAPNLFWDGVDGLGVNSLDANTPGDGVDDEMDEIDQREALVISFAVPANLGSVWLSDLFGHENGPNGNAELGRVILDLENGDLRIFDFNGLGDELLGDPGFTFVDFGQVMPVVQARFLSGAAVAPGTTLPGEYSVVGFTDLLLGAGGGGIGGGSSGGGSGGGSSGGASSGGPGAVDEPASIALALAGGLGLAALRRRRGVRAPDSNSFKVGQSNLHEALPPDQG